MSESGAKLRLLCCTAHPDDETFGCGGTLAKYASKGVEVYLACATRGEVGPISDPAYATRENLAEVREQELRDACQVLGVKGVFLLGYRDSGMDGADDNKHPNAFCGADLTRVTGLIVEIVRRLRPQVMLTFEPYGGYGHPDHKAIHQAARQAFYVAGDPTQYPEQLSNGFKPYSPRKLYYFGFPRSLTRELAEEFRRSRPESDISDIDANTWGVPDEDITITLALGEHYGAKEQAAMCHRTQVGDRPFSWLPDSLRERFAAQEYLIRAEPPVTANLGTAESDIFDGI